MFSLLLAAEPGWHAVPDTPPPTCALTLLLRDARDLPACSQPALRYVAYRQLCTLLAALLTGSGRRRGTAAASPLQPQILLHWSPRRAAGLAICCLLLHTLLQVLKPPFPYQSHSLMHVTTCALTAAAVADHCDGAAGSPLIRCSLG